MDKQALFTSRLLELCSTPGAARSVTDIRFIRDRLHERFPFFKVWPPLMQQLLCQLAVSQRWVQNQVLLSAGQAPTTLFFLVTGQVAICVRSPPDSSQLADVTRLGPGDTCGEAALLGAAASSTFLVVASREAAGLAVDAAQLATRLAALKPAAAPALATNGSTVYGSVATASSSRAPGTAAAAASAPVSPDGVPWGRSTGGGVCSNGSRRWPPSPDGGVSFSSSKAISPPVGATSSNGTPQVARWSPGGSSWSGQQPSSPSGRRGSCSSICSSAGLALNDQQQQQQQRGGISRKWGDLQTLTDASDTKSVADLYSMIGCKPPTHPPLVGAADRGTSPSSGSSRRGGGGRGQLAAEVVITAAPTTKQQQQALGAVLDRRVQLAAVSALEQQALNSWKQATGVRPQPTRAVSPTTGAALHRDVEDGAATFQLHQQRHHVLFRSADATAAAADTTGCEDLGLVMDVLGGEAAAAAAAAAKGQAAGRRGAPAQRVRPFRELPHIHPARLHGVQQYELSQ